MDAEVNKDIASFLCHSAIPIEKENAPLKEGRKEKTDYSKMRANKEDVDNAGQEYGANEKDNPDSYRGEPGGGVASSTLL